MADERRVPVTDKRRTQADPSPGSPPSPAGASDPAGSPRRSPPEADASSESRPPAPDVSSATPDSHGATSESRAVADVPVAAVERDYLADLQRLQAEFDNYRKRTLKEQTALVQRASERLVERLLPVLDNLENAIAHGEGGAGVELTHKELVKALGDEGLAEITAEGQAFDPRVHDAFEVVEADDVSEPTVRRVLRKGYRLRDRVLRPAMVGVARPLDASAEPDARGDGDAAPEGSEE